ncbi:MAG: Glu/Leu/Phe/Val dehydrogenase [Gemmatimonadales bacterium]
MPSLLPYGDDLGPAKIIRINQPALGLEAALVVDNVARGPSIGGLRMASDVTLQECARLARAMTLKNAAADLPHGGGKSVLLGDPHQLAERKEALIRAFAHALRHEADYIFGPDMGTDEACMGWVTDEIGRAVGLPAALGGIPLDELGATGFGLLHAALVAAPTIGLELEGARVAVQGFGAVGTHAARFLVERGARLVAASDSKATVVRAGGLDVSALVALKHEGKSIGDLPDADRRPNDAVIDVECDIWIPAARPDVITSANVDRLRTRLVLQGANIPFSADAERSLAERRVLVIPDFIANAGGVICAALEYAGATRTAAFEAIAEKIRGNVAAVIERSRAGNLLPREAATALATERVRDAMRYRRFGML